MGVGSSRGDAVVSLWFEKKGRGTSFFSAVAMPEKFFSARR